VIPISPRLRDNGAGHTMPILLTPEQTTVALGIGRSQLWRMHSAARLPMPVRLGPRCPRWFAVELSEWAAAGCPPRDVWERLKKSSD
jgi:predicted DNA-binding transcriptional regulator AlpA